MKIRNILFIAIVLIAITQTVSATIEINSGATLPYSINVDGETYELTENIVANSTAIIINACNITFNGNGHTITFSETAFGQGIYNPYGYDNITINNVKIVNTHIYATESNCIYNKGDNNNINDCYVNSEFGYGIKSEEAVNLIVDNCTAISKGRYAISISDSHDCIINNSYAETDAWAALVFKTNAYNNTFSNCTGRAYNVPYSFGASFSSGSNNNTFLNCNITSELGVALSMPATTSYNNVINCNIVGLVKGLSIASTNNNLISGGKSQGTTEDGIYLDTSDNNTFIDHISEGGIYLDTSDNNTFIDLISYGINNYGIYVISSNNNTFTNVTAKDDIYNGINIKRSYDNIFSDMTIIAPYGNTLYEDNNILVVGDSISSGFPKTEFNCAWSTPFIALDGGEYHLSNEAIGGSTSLELLNCLPQELAIFEPDYVFIMIGTNDIGTDQQTIIDHVISACDLVNAIGAIPIVCTIIPRRTDNTLTIAYNTALISQVEAAGYKVINTYDCLDIDPENGVLDTTRQTELYNDDVHPNTAGYSVMGSYIYRNFNAYSNIYKGTDLTQTISEGNLNINSRDIHTSDTLIQMSITPSSDSVNVSVSSWTTDSKTWTESSETHDISTSHLIGGCPANKYIDIYIDGNRETRILSNSAGYISFLYSGGFSEHEFEAVVVLSEEEYHIKNIKNSSLASVAFALLSLTVFAAAMIIGVLTGKIDGGGMISATISMICAAVIFSLGAIIILAF